LRLQRDLFTADHGAPVLAPLLDELGVPLLLDVVMRDGRGGLGGHEARLPERSLSSAHFTIE
jgi:hypothetical protein